MSGPAEGDAQTPGSSPPLTRLAHLSDPHAFSIRSVRPSFLFDQRAFGTANTLIFRQRRYDLGITAEALDSIVTLDPDHVVVTGDVTTLGAPVEFRRFRGLLARRPSLDGERVTVLPGNHDAYVPSTVRRKLFGKILGDYHRSEAPFEHQAWPLVRIRGSLALIGLCTSRPSLPMMAVGTLGARQLALLEATLADPALDGLARVIAMHHPSQTESPGLAWHNRLTDAQEFRAVLERQGAELVIHGHLHRQLERELPGPEGPIPVRGVPSSSSRRRRAPERIARFRVYGFQGRAFVAEESWIRQRRQRRFVPE